MGYTLIAARADPGPIRVFTLMMTLRGVSWKTNTRHIDPSEPAFSLRKLGRVKILIDYKENYNRSKSNYKREEGFSGSPLYLRLGSSCVCRLSKNHWRQVIKNRVQTLDVGLIIATTTTPRPEGQNPRLYFTITTKTHSPEPASHTKLDAELDAHIPTKGKVQVLPQWLNARLEACVSITEEPCVSVITVLISGSITAHVMREVSSHYGNF